MYFLAGYSGLNVFVIYRVLFLGKGDAEQAQSKSLLQDYSFLSPMTLAQVTEHVTNIGTDNVLLVPLNPELPEENKE